MRPYIMLIEDEYDEALLFIKAFKKIENPIDVTHFNDSLKALKYLNDNIVNCETHYNLPNIILLDIQMPKKNGLELLKELKTHRILKLIPIIMLSSSAEPLDVKRSYDYGANSYIKKPVDFFEFKEIAQIISEYWFKVNTYSTF